VLHKEIEGEFQDGAFGGFKRELLVDPAVAVGRGTAELLAELGADADRGTDAVADPRPDPTKPVTGAGCAVRLTNYFSTRRRAAEPVLPPNPWQWRPPSRLRASAQEAATGRFLVLFPKEGRQQGLGIPACKWRLGGTAGGNFKLLRGGPVVDRSWAEKAVVVLRRGAIARGAISAVVRPSSASSGGSGARQRSR